MENTAVKNKEHFSVKTTLTKTNSSPYFSCTAEGYEIAANGRRINEIYGCQHEEIEARFPGQYTDIIALHLSDFNGVPMYVVENGYYYYSARYPSESTWFEALREHLRISETECKSLVKSLDAIIDNTDRKHFFSTFVQAQKSRWLQEAKDCIKKHNLIMP